MPQRVVCILSLAVPGCLQYRRARGNSSDAQVRKRTVSAGPKAYEAAMRPDALPKQVQPQRLRVSELAPSVACGGW